MPKSWSASQSRKSLGGARSILRGDLGEISLCTLLGMMEMERRSGVLVLQKGRELGRLFVREGQVLRAAIEATRARKGAEAVYELIAWTEGQFELWHTAVDGPDEIAERTTYLLMEGFRRQDEAEETPLQRNAEPPAAEGANVGFGI